MEFPLILPRNIKLNLPAFAGISQSFSNAPTLKSPIQNTYSGTVLEVEFPPLNSTDFASLLNFWQLHNLWLSFSLTDLLDAYNNPVINGVRADVGLLAWRFKEAPSFSYAAYHSRDIAVETTIMLVSSVR